MDTLPNEIILKILTYCRKKDLINISMTCSHFKSFIDSDKLWEMLLKRHYPWDSFKKYNGYQCLLMEHIYSEDLASDRYELLNKKSKDYYNFLEYYYKACVNLYYQSIDRVLEHMCYLKKSIIPPYKKIIKECKSELLLYILIYHRTHDSIDDILPLLQYVDYSFESQIDKNSIKRVKDIISKKITKILTGMTFHEKMDTSEYHTISKILINNGFSNKESITKWLNKLNIPLYDDLLNTSDEDYDLLDTPDEDYDD